MTFPRYPRRRPVRTISEDLLDLTREAQGGPLVAHRSTNKGGRPV